MQPSIFRLAISSIVSAAALSPAAFAAEVRGKPPVITPFEQLDTLCVNDWWNREESPIVSTRVPRDEVVAFGIYTLSNRTVKLTAQLFPLYPEESRFVRLELNRGDGWSEAAQAKINDLGWSACFRLEDWDDTQNVKYRLRHGKEATFEGLIRKNPSGEEAFSVAVLSCNSRHDRGQRQNYVRNLRAHDPDLLFFAGDQSYDHREHTAAWLKFGLQFRDAFRDRPCITIPDDHDVGQANLWGEGGKKASLPGGADGGYLFHPEYVRMVERCQTAHLPNPIDPKPIGQGIGVYFTRMEYGGIDFAIIEDRKFKSGPAGKVPQQGPRPDHISQAEYDPKSLDQDGLQLLGQRQLRFLERWATDHQAGTPKVVLSQTVFCGGPHLHGTKGNRLFADLDSNGWPQTGRDAAVRLLREADAIHLAGDQHIPMLLEYGVDDQVGTSWAFASPAMVNTIYGRWWAPLATMRQGEPPASPALMDTGDYVDGFGNLLTMHAYANPETQDNGAGYGLIRFAKKKRTVTFECWPRSIDVTTPDAVQFAGWPKTIQLGE